MGLCLAVLVVRVLVVLVVVLDDLHPWRTAYRASPTALRPSRDPLTELALQAV